MRAPIIFLLLTAAFTASVKEIDLPVVRDLSLKAPYLLGISHFHCLSSQLSNPNNDNKNTLGKGHNMYWNSFGDCIANNDFVRLASKGRVNSGYLTHNMVFHFLINEGEREREKERGSEEKEREKKEKKRNLCFFFNTHRNSKLIHGLPLTI